MTRYQDGPAIPDRIIRAAVALFSRQGYYQTGTREIARLADISEVTLFRYFEHKEDIFVAALDACFKSVEPRLDLLSRGVEGRSPEEVVPKIVRLLIDITTFSPELLRMVAVAALELRGKYQEHCCDLLAPLLTAISSYLKFNMESGRVRNLNPAIATAALTLTVAMQPQLTKLIEGCNLSRMNGREALEEYSTFWLKILLPSASEGIVKSVVAAELRP